ncbi:heme exporter protein CcmD [Candidatus Thiodictyon syntrophicum]|uniref:Heme exporter protein D n=1 Tax=Candidatus Thiodictyon syntrophicum TaxID=1166950 RepID=A0A2K8UH28_9GAMM|nr:heme exporter protein CcmD [Candidatus Thiodictyon syntrophicum]AUB84893.1 heme exporter protein CcmD [Candidatus Thiodictyon syntrophicum]
MLEFLSQGGYGGYIWSAYGMTLALLVIETLGLRRGQRAILARLQRLLRLRNAGDKQ